jgi:subtilisin family serine protease
MAGPHVAGLAAYLLGYEGKWTPTQLGARITAFGSSGRVTGVPSGTKNLLVYNNSGR